MNTTRITLYSQHCTGSANDCRTNISANLLPGDYQLAVESFTINANHPCVVSAHGIFAQDSWDNSVKGEQTNLLTCHHSNSFFHSVSKDTIGFKVIPNINNQTLFIKVRNLAGNAHESVTNWVMTLVIFPL